MKRGLREVKALAFDIFGTVVDWRGSLIAEGRKLGRRKRIKADWAAFADAWRAGYRPAMDRVRRGELGWTKIDDLHRMILDGLIPGFGLLLVRFTSQAEQLGHSCVSVDDTNFFRTQCRIEGELVVRFVIRTANLDDNGRGALNEILA